MNLLGLVGDHPRHRYIAQKLAEGGHLAGLVVERREEHVPDPPERLDPDLADLFEHHFERRAEAEDSFFGDCTLPEVPQVTVSTDTLNSDKVRAFIRDIDPSVAVSYGVHILSDETLASIDGYAWNVHGGLSPEYRGVITHFWPSYMLEPQMTGVTLHELTPEIDAGPIVHQTAAPLERGDGLHELASRTVERFGDELPHVLELADTGELDDRVPQERSGKLWVASDWRPEHLRVIYEHHDNRIVDKYLDGELEQREPDLVRQF